MHIHILSCREIYPNKRGHGLDINCEKSKDRNNEPKRKVTLEGKGFESLVGEFNYLRRKITANGTIQEDKERGRVASFTTVKDII